jgi:murein DD-endopeptidase MepM/ murein hydrolase activator NlpD
MPYLVLEGMVRELVGPGRVLGNHVVLDLGGGVNAALAHLRRGSVLVRPGDRVAADQPLAACGNSGDSTEPHLHFRLMDHPSVLLAAGLPLRFDRDRVAGADQAGVPSNLQPFTDTLASPRPARIWVSSPPKEWPMTTGCWSRPPMMVAKWSATCPTDLPVNTSGCAVASATVSGSSGHPGVRAT